VRALSRVADANTEPTWVESATGKTVREVEQMVAGHQPGDLPDDPTSPADHRHARHRARAGC
jgi:hypothetical protein